MNNNKYIYLCVIVMLCLFPAEARANGSLSLAGRFSWVRPLAHESRAVTLVLDDGLLMMEIEETFSNPNESRLEGVYRFSLPDQAFVTGFQIMTDGKNWVPGRVMEIGQARLAYQEIVARQMDPGLMEQHGNELLIRVFPIEPRAPVRIRFRSHLAAPAVKDRIDLALPLGIDSEAEEEVLGPDGGPKGRTKLTINGTIRDIRGVSTFETEPVSTVTRKEDGETAFRLGLPAGPAGAVRLRIRLKTPAAAGVTGYAEPDGTRFLLARIPPLPVPEKARRGRVNVVLDTSGSMGGNNRARAERLLKRLGEVVETDLYAFSGTTLARITPDVVAEQTCFGAVSWGRLELPVAASGADGTLLITDGEELSPADLARIWDRSGRRPLWIALFAPEIPGELVGFLADKGGLVRLFDEAGREQAESALARAMRDIGISLHIQLPGDDRGVPLFGKLACGEGTEAFLVVPAASLTAPIRVADHAGTVLWEAADPGPASDLPARGWLTALVARQRVLSLACRPQTPDVVREITRLGLAHNLATEYTAFLAVPEDIARQYAELLNPSYLAVFSPPAFRKAREQSRGKACLANQRVLLGAVEMYNMDHAAMMDRDPETLSLDIDRLTAEGFLKGGISKPDPACRYLAGPGSLLATGSIFCVRHGYAEGNLGKPAEEQFADACAAAGYDPADFDIEFPADESPLESWLSEYRQMLYFIRIFI